ncbi:MAG: hypothetical protein ACRELD_11035 [Longimicrobiales bacterium]
MCHLLRRRITALHLLLLGVIGGSGIACAAAEQRPQFWAFTGPWDPRSDSSVSAHGTKLDAVISGWITIDSLTGQPVLPSPYPDTVRPREGAVRRLAIVTSWHGDRFHRAPIELLARDAQALGSAAGGLAAYAAAQRYDGLVFDFETLEAADLEAHVEVLRALADSARAIGVGTIAVAIPATDTAAYPVRPLLAIADALIVMLYDQHWLSSGPGPIASPAWVQHWLNRRIAEAGPERLIAGLPLYGYRWQARQPTEPVTFSEAAAYAEGTGVPLRRDSASRTLRSVAPDGAETWVTDAALLRVLVDAARKAGVHRFALWRLGQEDPAIWGTVIR